MDYFYYVIAEEVHLGDMANLVNNMIKSGEGWTPVGGVFIHPHHGTFCQAMHRTNDAVSECIHCPDNGFVRV